MVPVSPPGGLVPVDNEIFVELYYQVAEVPSVVSELEISVELSYSTAAPQLSRENEISVEFSYDVIGWLHGFIYRVPIEIVNKTPLSLSWYQMPIWISTWDPMQYGKMNSDCSDIRVTDSDGVTLLQYAIDPDPGWGCNIYVARMWVLVPSIPPGKPVDTPEGIRPGVKTIYIYYGNPSAHSMSNPEAVFMFYDDFETGDLGKWVDARNARVVDDGTGNKVLELHATDVDSFVKAFVPHDNVRIEFRYAHIDPGPSGPRLGVSFRVVDDNNRYEAINEIGAPVSGYKLVKWVNGVRHDIAYERDIPFAYGTFYRNFVYAGDSAMSMTLLNYPFSEVIDTTFTSGSQIIFRTWDSGNKLWIDNVRVRQFITAEIYGDLYFIHGSEETRPYMRMLEGIGEHEIYVELSGVSHQQLQSENEISVELSMVTHQQLQSENEISVELSMVIYQQSQSENEISVEFSYNIVEWLHGFIYRIPIEIINESQLSLSWHQIPILLNTQSLITEGKMNSDCGDIRVTDSDGVTLLQYAIDPDPGLGCNSVITHIWVLVPSIPPGKPIDTPDEIQPGVKTIYIYYGNPSAHSMSNPDAVFIFYDDFETGNLGKWIDTQNASIVDDGTGNKVLELHATDVDSFVKAIVPHDNVRIEYRYAHITPGPSGPRLGISFRVVDDNNRYEAINEVDTNANGYKIAKWVNGIRYNIAHGVRYPFEYGSWHKNFICATDSIIRMTMLTSMLIETVDTTFTSGNQIIFRTWDSGNKLWIDNIKVMRFVRPQLYWALYYIQGPEETRQ